MLKIHIINDNQNKDIQHSGGPLEFGRGPQRDLKRFMIEDGSVSRDHLRVEELPGGRVQLQNLSLKVAILLGDGTSIPQDSSREVTLPVQLTLGKTLIALSSGATDILPTES